MRFVGNQLLIDDAEWYYKLPLKTANTQDFFVIVNVAFIGFEKVHILSCIFHLRL